MSSFSEVHSQIQFHWQNSCESTGDTEISHQPTWRAIWVTRQVGPRQ